MAVGDTAVAGAPQIEKRGKLDATVFVALIVITLVAYIRTLRPSFGWGDSSELITAAYFLGVGHSPGYPLWMLIMYPFSHIPIGSVAFRLNFMDAFLGSVGVGLLYLLYRRIAGNRPAAIIAALTFAFSTTFWDQTTEADVFTLHVCLAATIILIALAWRNRQGVQAEACATQVSARRTHNNAPLLYLLSWVIGISLGNHALTALMIPALLYLVWAEGGRKYFTARRVFTCLGLFALGLSIYVYLPIRGAANPPPHINNPHNLMEIWAQITAPGARHSMFDRGLIVPLHRALLYIMRLANEFGRFGCAIAVVGFGMLWRRDRRLTIFLALIGVTDIAYSVNFSIFDIYVYFLPLYIVWAAWIAVGMAGLLALVGRLMAKIPAAVMSPTPIWRYGPAIALLMAVPCLQFARNLSRVDGSQDYGSERFARAVLKQVKPGSLILADWWAIAPMGYLKYIEGQRKDLVMFAAPSLYQEDAFLDFAEEDFLRNYPAVYFVEILTYRIHMLRQKAYLVPAGPVHRVYVKRPAPKTLLANIPANPVARFGDRVGLVRAEVGSGPLRPGECVDFTLYWTPLGGFNGKKHEAILVLQNEKTGRIWQESNVLGHDLYPVERWTKGQVLKEEHRIYLPDPVASGEYNLYLRVREQGVSRCLNCDRHPADGNVRDYLIGTLRAEDAPPSPTGRDGIPRAIAMLRP